MAGGSSESWRIDFSGFAMKGEYPYHQALVFNMISTVVFGFFRERCVLPPTDRYLSNNVDADGTSSQNGTLNK